MNGKPYEFIEDATPDELHSCIRLLAISIVQHRAKPGFVALSQSTDQLRAKAEEARSEVEVETESGAEETGLFFQGKEVLEEALEFVRTLAAEAAAAKAAQEEADKTPVEKRTQIRIKISVPITVLWPQDTMPVNAFLEDISWGGASIRVEETKIDLGDKLQIFLPTPQGDSIPIEAKILRTWPLSDDQGHGIAARFSSLSTLDEEKLEGILEHLSLSADDAGQRGSARLTPRLDIQFENAQELQSTLNDISAGGMSITLPDPLQIGQSLQAVISTLDDSFQLKLRARVVRQEPIKFGNREVYQVGLKFEHPSSELKKRTSELISNMATTRNK